MADLACTLPEEVEIGAMRRLEYSTETTTTDGGFEVRNARWAEPLRVYELSYPHAVRTDPVYLAVLELYEEALGGLYSFNFKDWIDGSTVTVRFDSPLEIDSPAGHLDHIVSMTLKEVRT